LLHDRKIKRNKQTSKPNIRLQPPAQETNHSNEHGDQLAHSVRITGCGEANAIRSALLRRRRGGRRARGAAAASGTSSARAGTGLTRDLAQRRQRRAGVEVPATSRRRRARQGSQVRRGGSVVRQSDARGSQRRPAGLQVCEIRHNRDGRTPSGKSALDVGRRRRRGARHARSVTDQAVVVGLLDPLVDDGAGPGVLHLRAEDGGLVVEIPRFGLVTTRLGEEDGDRVAGGVLLQLGVTRRAVGGGAAPFVGVEREEVQVFGAVGRASEVVLQHGTQTGDISRGISDGDLTVALGVSVRFNVARRGLDVGSSLGAVQRGEDLIANEHTGNIVVAVEGVQHLFVCGELGVGPAGGILIDGIVEGLQVDKQIDPCVLKGRHASVVVTVGVHVVDADGVSAEFLHPRCVELALLGIDEGIAIGELVGDTCGLSIR
jgi:hypothetical protein